VKDLHDIATKTQNLSRRGTGKVRNMVQTLNQYSGVLDVVSQWHPEYSALVWGTIKWLLLIAMNYINLTQRIAAMLEEIGDNLPRCLLTSGCGPQAECCKSSRSYMRRQLSFSTARLSISTDVESEGISRYCGFHSRPGFRRPWRRFSGSKSASEMMPALQR